MTFTVSSFKPPCHATSNSKHVIVIVLVWPGSQSSCAQHERTAASCAACAAETHPWTMSHTQFDKSPAHMPHLSSTVYSNIQIDTSLCMCCLLQQCCLCTEMFRCQKSRNRTAMTACLLRPQSAFSLIGNAPKSCAAHMSHASHMLVEVRFAIAD